MIKKLNRKFEIKIPIKTSASDTLNEVLEIYNISQTDFAKRIEISKSHLSEILNRKKYMTEDTAFRIQAVTGISAKYLMKLDFQYKLAQINEEEDRYEELESYTWSTTNKAEAKG